MTALTVGQALARAAARLAATSDSARWDAEWLMAHALGVSRADLLLRHMREAAPAGFDALVERRSTCEPVAYITGRQAFWGLDFAVGPAVLIPRADSEALVALAAAGPAPARVLDLGTGSGALLLAVLHEWPGAQGLGIDRSAAAIEVARANAARIAPGRTEFAVRDWTQAGWSDDLGRFDCVLANPPYVETGAALDPDVAAHEPHGALFAGPEGLDDYRLLVPQLPALIAPGGRALVEIGWRQGEAVMALARAAGMAAKVHPDLAGRARVVEMTVPADAIVGDICPD